MANGYPCQICGKPTEYNYGPKYEMVCQECSARNEDTQKEENLDRVIKAKITTNRTLKAFAAAIFLIIAAVIFAKINSQGKPHYVTPDIVVVIESNSEWSGFFENRSIDGKGDQIIEIGNAKIIAANIQKKDAYGGHLSGYILDRANHLRLSETISTEADYGVITLSAVNSLYDE